MKHITFYLDFISPYAYLAFEHLPEVLQCTSYSVAYTPVLFAGMLKHHGQLGPAEITPKRHWTYRQVLWQANRLGIAMQMPAAHPFHPLALLRLAAACGNANPAGTPNRFVCEQIFRHVWQGGAAADDTSRLSTLMQALSSTPALEGFDLPALSQGDAAKARVKTSTDDAIARDVFGVPAFAVDDKVFWGLDALPMLRDYLLGDAWFDGPDWDAACQVPAAVTRQK